MAVQYHAAHAWYALLSIVVDAARQDLIEVAREPYTSEIQRVVMWNLQDPAFLAGVAEAENWRADGKRFKYVLTRYY
jgi:hypothetical protein